MTPQELKFKQMTEPPVEKLICKLAVPCIISMLVTSFYNMADTFSSVSSRAMPPPVQWAWCSP